VLREGAVDWYWNATIKQLDTFEIRIDIHHIFPKAWCNHNRIDWRQRDSILNKTPISYKANRKIGGQAPSIYLSRLQRDSGVDMGSTMMDKLLVTHALDPDLLRRDAFDKFLEDRRERLGQLVEKAMGKKIAWE